MTWAIKGEDLESIVEQAAAAGVPFGPVRAGRRVRADGVELSWTFTDPVVLVSDGLVPFFIDWGGGAHPATTAPGGLTLVSLRGEHPTPADVRAALSALAIDLPVNNAPAPRLIATLMTRDGLVDLA